MCMVRRPDSIVTALHSLVIASLVSTCMAAMSAAAIAFALAGATTRSVHRCYTAFARFGLAVARTRLEVHGRENVDPTQAYVVVLNHESNWDPLCIIAALPELILRFVVKTQIMKIPILGQALRLTGNVEVVRRRDPGDVRRLQQTMSDRNPEVSMLFFAEGTRARDGSFREFKMGAFATALEAGLPILPVALSGTFWIWPPESFWFRRGGVVIEVGSPTPTDKLGYEDRSALRDQVRETVGELRLRGRERIRAKGLEPGGID